jgi:hypothetical protein
LNDKGKPRTLQQDWKRQRAKDDEMVSWIIILAAHFLGQQSISLSISSFYLGVTTKLLSGEEQANWPDCHGHAQHEAEGD